MAFLDSTTAVIDAILTRKGRELLAKNDGSFQITKFAFGDDEINYQLYDATKATDQDSDILNPSVICTVRFGNIYSEECKQITPLCCTGPPYQSLTVCSLGQSILNCFAISCHLGDSTLLFVITPQQPATSLEHNAITEFRHGSVLCCGGAIIMFPACII